MTTETTKPIPTGCHGLYSTHADGRLVCDACDPRCGCRITGPLAIDALVGDGAARSINGRVYEILYCPTHAAAPEMLVLLRSVSAVHTQAEAPRHYDATVTAIRALLRRIE